MVQCLGLRAPNSGGTGSILARELDPTHVAIKGSWPPKKTEDLMNTTKTHCSQRKNLECYNFRNFKCDFHKIFLRSFFFIIEISFLRLHFAVFLSSGILWLHFHSAHKYFPIPCCVIIFVYSLFMSVMFKFCIFNSPNFHLLLIFISFHCRLENILRVISVLSTLWLILWPNICTAGMLHVQLNRTCPLFWLSGVIYRCLLASVGVKACLCHLFSS